MKYLVDKKTKEHRPYHGSRKHGEKAVENGDYSLYVVEADSEGWVPHTGNECPLPDDVRCEVRCVGCSPTDIIPAGGWLWNIPMAGTYRITYYRPILTEKVQEPEPIPAPQYDPRSVSFNLIHRLQAAHQSAQQIPDLEAELRLELAGMGYTLGMMSPFVESANSTAVVAEPEAAQDKVIAGALFDFLGFLTTRDKPTSFGATRNASPAVKLLQEWANKRGLDLDGADVEGWRHGEGE